MRRWRCGGARHAGICAAALAAVWLINELFDYSARANEALVALPPSREIDIPALVLAEAPVRPHPPAICAMVTSMPRKDIDYLTPLVEKLWGSASPAEREQASSALRRRTSACTPITRSVLSAAFHHQQRLQHQLHS
jgi:hypothetical protein